MHRQRAHSFSSTTWPMSLMLNQTQIHMQTNSSGKKNHYKEMTENGYLAFLLIHIGTLCVLHIIFSPFFHTHSRISWPPSQPMEFIKQKTIILFPTFWRFHRLPVLNLVIKTRTPVSKLKEKFTSLFSVAEIFIHEFHQQNRPYHLDSHW